MVSMNMNYCYTLNWWTLSKPEDPASGLLWLNGVLEQAEMDGEKVRKIQTSYFFFLDNPEFQF